MGRVFKQVPDTGKVSREAYAFLDSSHSGMQQKYMEQKASLFPVFVELLI